MTKFIRSCSSLLSGINNTVSYQSIPLQQHLTSQPLRSIFTSQILLAKTKKRRKRYPFFWLQDKYRAYYDENLTPENEQFFQNFLREKFSLNGASPLKTEPWSNNATYTETSVRTGLIARKLGTFPMWTKNGTRLVTTCLYVPDNHVIRYDSPEEFDRLGRPVDRKRYKGFGRVIVGADSRDPRTFTAEYNGLFKESAVMPKKKLTRFFVTHDARLEPGTPLLVSHYRPGMYVQVYGKTIEWGKKGVRFRYKMKLGRKTHGATKNHNRVGSIGRGRKKAGPLKGRRMPGYHGGERRTTAAIKVWRVDTKRNLLYVHGPGIPGENGSYVNVYDAKHTLKKFKKIERITPPFPTTTLEEHNSLDEELYEPSIHLSSEPSIVLEVTEEEKRAAALIARSLGKAKTAQKVR